MENERRKIDLERAGETYFGIRLEVSLLLVIFIGTAAATTTSSPSLLVVNTITTPFGCLQLHNASVIIMDGS